MRKKPITAVETYSNAYLFNVTKQGIYYEKVKIGAQQDYRSETALVKLGNGLQALTRSHFIDSEDSFYRLENLIKKAALSGRQGKSIFVIGHRSDPFSDYSGKFKLTSKLLEMFQKYQVGRVLLQTYSNQVVLAISKLLPLKEALTINLVIETPAEDIAHRYSPGKATISERIKAARALKTFGFDVEIQVAPLLPYRGGRSVAAEFAEQLVSSSNRIFVASYYAAAGTNRQNKKSPLAVGMAAAGHGAWLRKGAEAELIAEITALNPSHLECPLPYYAVSEQLDLFVA